jgi:signal transduction histidine kinase
MAKTSELIEERTLRSRLDRLQRVLQINRELSAMLDPQELLGSIVRAAAELTDSEQGAIAQYDPSEDCLRFITAPWLDEELMKRAKVPIESSIMGQAFRTLWPVISEEVKEDSQHYTGVDSLTGFETRSMLAVPLAVQGQATGVLSAVNKRGGDFDKEDVFVMESLAAQAAIAIQNAHWMRESREAYNALAELDEMRNDFIAITSHELRIPLGLILGHASYLKETLDGEARQQIEVIERGALRLKQIVEDLSKIEIEQSGNSAVRYSAYDLAAQLRQILATHQAAAKERGIELAGKLPTEPLVVEAEANKVFVAVDHLVKNALLFTNKGGQVELSLQDDGDWANIQVADSGVGIPAKDLEKIFDRFYQVEDHMTRRHGGMGLGLTVAKMLVEMHAGSISVESVEGKGSRFTIKLPKAPRA